MRAVLTFIDRRGLRLSSLTLAGAALLAACDTDRPTEPTPSAMPVAPSLAKGGNLGGLIISLVDQNNQSPANLGAQYTVAKSGGMPTVVADNGPSDSNSYVGLVVMLNIAPGTYTVCQTAAPSDFVLPSPQPCQTIGVLAGSNTPGTASVIQFVNLTVPRATWVAFDDINWDSIPGVTFTGDDGSGPVAILDNSPLDLDPTPGKFAVQVPNGTSYTVCPKATPAGYVFPTIPQGCVTKPMAPGTTTAIGNMYVRHEFSAYWYVSLGSLPSKGSEFTITQGTTGNTIKVADNGMNDMSLGMTVYVKLPAAGWYTVCMTTPPVGGQISDPSCRRIDVQLGELTYAGFFDSKPI
jgi:hypothetical protein